MRYIASAFAVCVAMMSSVAAAAPVMLVPPGSGDGWWIRKLILRPVEKSVAGVTVDQINTELGKTGAVPAKVCFVGRLSAASIVGTTRATQLEIDETLSEFANGFERTVVAAPGKSFRLIAGIYEDCEGSGASFLMAVGADGRLHSFMPQETDFIWMFARDGAVTGFSSCYYCGAVAELQYDVRRDRFYQEYVGD